MSIDRPKPTNSKVGIDINNNIRQWPIPYMRTQDSLCYGASRTAKKDAALDIYAM